MKPGAIHLPRLDGFFQESITENSSASELWEGIYEITRTEHEQSKLEFIAYLNAAIPFVTISRGEANRLIHQLQVLTYRKMCIIAAISQGANRTLRDKCISKQEGSDELGDIMQDCFELEQMGLLQEPSSQSPAFGTHSWLYVVPSELNLTKYGNRMVELAKLRRISNGDVEEIYRLMS